MQHGSEEATVTNGVKLGIVAAALVGWGVGGCATKQRTGAAIGGATGAVVGAGVGAAAGGKKGAVVGAAAGAAVGAGSGALVGRYMDKQEAELRKEVETAKIVRKGDELVVEFKSAILFDTGRAELREAARNDLDEFADVLKKYDQTNLVVEGHTDSTGGREINEKLSLARAEVVVEYLAGRGVARGRLTPRGQAYDEPIASNKTSDGRQRNRRVEVEIAPSEELRRVDAEETTSRAEGTRPVARR
jgi:outer membrane protein OmpA-like peptidoglycan-associated protein